MIHHMVPEVLKSFELRSNLEVQQTFSRVSVQTIQEGQEICTGP